MTEQTDILKEMRAIIEELFSIIDHATLNIATWSQYDALQARYQELRQKTQEDDIWYQQER